MDKDVHVNDVMSSGAAAGGSPAWMRWTGRVLSGLIILFMLLDGVTKIMRDPHVTKAMADLQFPDALTQALGVVALLCAALYAIPRTSVLGAILLSGFLGGATAAKARQEDWGMLFPVVFGIVAWLGLYLRDERVRALIPLRRRAPR